jgi:hypothetical protein
MARGRYALIGVVGLAVGCSGPASEKPNESRGAMTADRDRANVTRGTFDGVSVDVMGAGDGATKLIEGPSGVDGLQIRRAKNTLEVGKGRLRLNGADGGPVQTGDKVRLEADGRLFVNDEERRVNKEPWKAP